MKNKIIAAIIAVVIIAIVCVLIFNFKAQKNGGENNASQEGSTEENTELTSLDLSNMVEFDDRVMNSDLELSDEVYSAVAVINDGIYKYYQNNLKNKNLISIYGYLYDDNKSDIVTADQLKADGAFECDEKYLNMDVLLMKPSSLAEYESLDIDTGDNSLEPFTALKLKEGYLVSSHDSAGGTLTDEEYRSLVLSYMFEHGDVKLLNYGDEGYDEIVSTVVNKAEFVNYDVKYVACDDMYAVAVIGDNNNVADNREYVLVNNNGWDIKIDGLETQDSPRWSVNSKLPNMELGLLPKYVIKSYGEVKKGFDSYVNSIIELGLVKKDELPTTYTSGVGKFVYLEFTSGKKLIGCVSDEGKLEFYEVKNSEEALEYMLKYDDNPPAFIIRYGQ